MINAQDHKQTGRKCPCDDCAGRRRKRRTTVQKAGITGIIASAMAMTTPFIMQWEGKRNVTYMDLGGIPTACYGATGPEVGKIGRAWSDDQCHGMLNADVVAHLNPIIECVPGLAGRANELAASTSLAFNIGAVAFCRSTAARKFNAGDWSGGCDAFLMWSRVHGRFVQGLYNRRRAERALCLRRGPLASHAT